MFTAMVAKIHLGCMDFSHYRTRVYYNDSDEIGGACMYKPNGMIMEVLFLGFLEMNENDLMNKM